MNDAELLRWLEGRNCGCGCDEKRAAAPPPGADPERPSTGPGTAPAHHAPPAFRAQRGFVSAAAPLARPPIPATLPDEPFVPALPSWDSPQRPGLWGAPHTPRTWGDAFGQLETAQNVQSARPSTLLETGRVSDEERWLHDHQRRRLVQWLERVEATDPGTPPEGGLPDLPYEEDVVGEEVYRKYPTLYDYLMAFRPDTVEIGPHTYDHNASYAVEQLHSWEDESLVGTGQTKATGSGLGRWIGYRPRTPDGRLPVAYRQTRVTQWKEDEVATGTPFYDLWIEGAFMQPGRYHKTPDVDPMVTESDGRLLYWVPLYKNDYQIPSRFMPSADLKPWAHYGDRDAKPWEAPSLLTAAEYYWLVGARDENYEAAPWRGDGRTAYYLFRHSGSADAGATFVYAQKREGTQLSLAPYDLFVSPDGEVRVTLEASGSPTLTAYGERLPLGTGHSWAACRDADGGTVVLHEDGQTVTALRPPSSPMPRESCSVAQFEAEVLRCEAGLFRRFSPTGQGHHSWPDLWAYAECGIPDAYQLYGHRALTGEAAWRDRRKRPLPEEALPSPRVWPGRPARRPAPGSAAPEPRSLLGLTLADVLGQAGHDDAWPRGFGPAQLPVAVRKLAGELTPEAEQAAVAALAKRFFCPPAGWPEELNDSRSLSLAEGMMITFTPLPDYPAGLWHLWLLLRAKLPPGAAEELNVGGVRRAMYRLGHNAPEGRGWHPYVVPLERTATPENDLTLSLAAPFPVSRLLLVSRWSPVATDDGGAAA